MSKSKRFGLLGRMHAVPCGLHRERHQRAVHAAQVRADCKPSQLLDFLAGGSAVAASEAAQEAVSNKAAEEDLLNMVCALLYCCTPDYSLTCS